jgi:PAS domain S-box-containing protein
MSSRSRSEARPMATRDFAVERALRAQSPLLASILDTLPLGVGIYDHHGHLVHSNALMHPYVGLIGQASRDPTLMDRWRGYEGDDGPITPDRYPGNRALRGETVLPGIDFLHRAQDGSERWIRVGAAPVRGEGEAIIVVQDIDDLKRATQRVDAASAELASQSRFLEAGLSSIPDFVYVFDPEKRFAYANAAMLALFGLSSDEMLGRTFADLDYPPELADELDGHIDRVLNDGVTTQGEVYYRSPTGSGAYFDFHWGPIRADDGSVELVVGVSRDTSERRAMEEKLRRSEARLRAATELVGLGIYSWDPVTGALNWDARVREMWGVPPDAPVDVGVFEAGIHPEDLARVHDAIAACVDPAGDGSYTIEYRLMRRDSGEIRHVATSGRTTFADGRAVGFIGAVNDVTAQRRAERFVRESEAQFRSFAEHSRSLLWIGDPEAGQIVYRSAAFERIWGVPCAEGPTAFSEWIKDVHPADRQQVERSLGLVRAGEAVQFEYRIIRPGDGAIRWLRETSFPIRDENGTVHRLGGITADLSNQDEHQLYIVSTKVGEARRLANLVRSLEYRVRTFDSASAFLDMAPVLTPGCVLVDVRQSRNECLAIPRELKARSIALTTVALGSPTADVASAVAAMKAGAIDFVRLSDEDAPQSALLIAISECHSDARPTTSDESAAARLARLTARERQVLVGLVDGGTNKTIGQHLGISPRTVELHRAQVMNRLNAASLTDLLQAALAAGIVPSGCVGRGQQKPT